MNPKGINFLLILLVGTLSILLICANHTNAQASSGSGSSSTLENLNSDALELSHTALGTISAKSNPISDTTIVSGLSQPTAMEFAPDGRIFINQQGGSTIIIKNGVKLATPFLTIPVNSANERGLLGITFDPNFASNGYVYIYHTEVSPIHNVVSRFTASQSNPDVANMTSRVDIIAFENVTNDNHNGGTIHFGPDGKLYISVRNDAINSNSQTLSNHKGKIIRINPDGTAPSDNPFFNQGGAAKDIWAYGLRNPFTFAFQPVTGKMYINDVGENTWEEVDNGTAGANYGWPICEGPNLAGSSTPCNIAGLTNPIYFYNHNGSSAAIAGGAFYEETQFPPQYKDNYFFGGYTDLYPFGFIGRLLTTNPPQAFKFLNASSPVNIKVGPDGSMYYLDWGSGNNDGELHKVQYITGVVGCVPPTSGDWTITTSCTLSTNTIVKGNVVVQNGAVLTVSNGVSLDIDFTTKHLLVKSGGEVLIKAGGKIF